MSSELKKSTKKKALLTAKDLVLVADDEELMREVVCIMIKDNGGEALPAVDGADAVKQFKKNRAKVRYVILDFSMPRLSGYEAYLKIVKIKPSVGIVFVSGLSITPEVEALKAKGKIVFLSKPFHEVELMRVLVNFKKSRSGSS